MVLHALLNRNIWCELQDLRKSWCCNLEASLHQVSISDEGDEKSNEVRILCLIELLARLYFDYYWIWLRKWENES